MFHDTFFNIHNHEKFGKIMKHFTKIFTLLTLCIITSNIHSKDAKTKNSKGKTVTQIQINQKLDVTTFTKDKSGVLFKILKRGSGSKPYTGETVTVDYTGWLLNGSDTVGQKFDSSVDRGQNFEFKLGVGHVIKGWDVSVADMQMGEKRLVIIPSSLAYGLSGVRGVIPPNASLIFEIDLYGAR